MSLEGETTLDAPEDGAQPRRIASFPHLFVVLLADRPLDPGGRHSLAEAEVVTFGRGDAHGYVRRRIDGQATLALSVPAPAMSSKHARLLRDKGRYVLEDTGSRNGTFVNGSRLDSERRRILEDGDVIEMGRAFFVFRAAMETPLATQADLELDAIRKEPAGFRTLIPDLASRHRKIQKLAPSLVPMLLLGETGSGKEVLARAIHEESRRSGPFVAVNCGALPATLVEGLLFGHAKGAFSGAVRDEPGFVRSAMGGTLLLDEIGDLPPSAQTALLRVLQESEVVPLGATRPVKVDVRILAATHKPLTELAASGNFRVDLLARLNGFMHALPPLRERREDFGWILADVLARVAGPMASRVTIAPAVARAMLRHDWPLNVRELFQTLQTSTMLATAGAINASELPAGGLQSLAQTDALPSSPSLTSIASEEAALSGADRTVRDSLAAALTEHNGNVAAVARAMGKAPIQIHRWMKRFGIDPNRYRA